MWGIFGIDYYVFEFDILVWFGFCLLIFKLFFYYMCIRKIYLLYVYKIFFNIWLGGMVRLVWRVKVINRGLSLNFF